MDAIIDAEAMLRAQQLVIDRLTHVIRLVTVDIDQSKSQYNWHHPITSPSIMPNTIRQEAQVR